MNTTECQTMEKLTDELLKCRINEDTDEYENPEAHRKTQNDLGAHLIICDHQQCVKSRKARIEVGIMNDLGMYLK